MTRPAAFLLALVFTLATPGVSYAQDPCEQEPPPPECGGDPPAYAVGVIPDGGLQPPRSANTTGYSAVFTVTNTGNEWDWYTLSCSSTGPVICTSLSTTDVALDPGGSTTVTAFYDVGAAGTGTLTLGAFGAATDFGYFSIPVVSSGVSVTPDGATSAVRATNTAGHGESFTVLNTGSASNTFSFTCSGGGGVTCGTVPAPVTLAASGQAGSQTTVTMPYSVGAPGTGTLTLTANGGNASNPGSYSVPIVTYSVAVTPDGSVTSEKTQNTTGHSAVFTVRNTGGGADTYTLSCTGALGVTCTNLTATSVPLNPNQSTNVTATFSVGAPGSGTLTLTATSTYATDPGLFTVPIISFVPSAVSGGTIAKDARYLLQETANTYEQYGRIEQLTDPRGKVTKYEYLSPNSPFVSKISRLNDAQVPALITTITYNAQGLVESIRDEGGSLRSFTYDAFGRLHRIKNNAGDAVRAYGYTYSRISPNWIFDPANPNAVVDTTFVQHTPTLKTVVSTSYVDGLGRPIQSVVKDGSDYHVSATQYDLMGRVWRVWKPYTRTNTPGYDPAFVTNATSEYNTYHATANAKPYTETSYTPDALSRVKQVTPEYIGTTPNALVGHAYALDVPAKHQYSEVTDEEGKKTRSFTDLFGNNVRTMLGYGTPESTNTVHTFNVLGELVQTTDPRGLITTYTRSTRSLLTGRTSPDAGTTAFKHDKAGNLRFSQDANQAVAGTVHFTNYDFAGRPLTSGVGAATFSALNPDVAEAFEATQGNWLVVRQYDAKPTNVFPWSSFWTQISPLTLNNVAGRPAAVASRSNGAWQVTLFSYDGDGQVATRYTYTQANGGGSVWTALNSTATYVRDLRGALTQRSLTVGSNSFYHWYDYDGRGLLSRLYASTSPTNPTPTTPRDVTDTYRPSGLPKDYQFLGGPLVPIRYTIREQTERIGDPTLATYPFSARYTYNRNGTLLETEFYNGGLPEPKRYNYHFEGLSFGYDALNRQKGADFTPWIVGSGWSPTSKHDLSSITYDNAGNIQTLQRRDEAGALVDNLGYNYVAGTNRLGSLTENAGATAASWDAEAGGFTYDANGNVRTAPAPYSISTSTPITYDPSNLPLTITRAGQATNYRYDNAGQRIAKHNVTTGNTEVYLREGGTTLGVFTVNSSGTPTSWHFNLVWEDRVVGRQPSAGNRRYYHFDHLGSTRVVVEGPTIVEGYDYDPWGLLMPGRTLAGPTKEGFTSKEQDAETGLNYFGARYYMAALGRWGAVDPKADSTPSWSAYNYVYDNPIRHTDPDGRQVAKCLVGESQSDFNSRNRAELLRTIGCGTQCQDRPLIDESWNTFSAVSMVPGASAVLRGGSRLFARRTARTTLSFGDDAARVTSTSVDDGLQAGTQTSEAFHHTFGRHLTSIEKEGLRPGAYATPTGQLSPIQAQIELALPPNRGLPDAVLRIDVAGLRQAGYEIPAITRVPGRFGLAGGGYQMQFPYSIPPEFLKVVRRR